MASWIPAAIGAAGQLGGAGLSAGLGIYESREARKFAREMRRTAYQTTVQDMRLAGLNPILAARMGPTQTPGVPASPVIPNFGQSFGQGLEAGASAMLKGEQSRTEGTRRGGITAQTGFLRQQTKESRAREIREQRMAGYYETQARALAARMVPDLMEAEFLNTAPGKAAWYTERTSRAANSVLDLVPSPFRRFGPPSRALDQHRRGRRIRRNRNGDFLDELRDYSLEDYPLGGPR